jgi:hypothetical protein
MSPASSSSSGAWTKPIRNVPSRRPMIGVSTVNTSAEYSLPRASSINAFVIPRSRKT